ncbi:MAG TPA: hypothetical protein VGG10_10880 [Rhizomicrobium sp.]|jgi:hypothetical protein
MKKTLLLGAFCLASLLPEVALADAASDCHVGAYRLDDRTVIDIAPSEGDTLRWRRFDGATGALSSTGGDKWTSTYGWTKRPDGHTVTLPDCQNLSFDNRQGARIAFDVTDTAFVSHDTKLVGRLVLPKGGGAVPIVVLTHGSENDSAIKSYALQRLFPSEGIGAFVFDKRGTGSSGGTYTQNFSLLADDDIAAMREARRLAGPRAGRVGYQGGSQAGWIIPLAVNRAPVDFAIVCFGLAVTVLQEDQQEVALEMKNAHHTPQETAKALEVARAAEAVIESKFTKGFAAFDAVRAKYRNEPWYKDVHGDFTYLLLPYDEKKLREIGPQYTFGTPFRYEPMPALQDNTTPQLWVLGSDDLEAPSAMTGARIKSLIGKGKPFTLALYPGAEHGMTLYELDAKGERLSTRYAPGYFTMMRDFIRDGRLHGSYGDAQISGPP